MSWSVLAVGRPQAVATEIARQFAKIKDRPPQEQFIVDAAATLVEQVLSNYPGRSPLTDAVKVEASGMESASDNRVSQSIRISVEPIWNFLE